MFQADDFANDPYGFATNQAGHGYLISIPMALALLPFWGPYATPIIAVVYGIVWEVICGANTTLYVKESGTGNTGWVAK